MTLRQTRRRAMPLFRGIWVSGSEAADAGSPVTFEVDLPAASCSGRIKVLPETTAAAALRKVRVFEKEVSVGWALLVGVLIDPVSARSSQSRQPGLRNRVRKVSYP